MLTPMKRLQIMIEREMDEALGKAARERGISKAAIIREIVGERLEPTPALEDDPLWRMVGSGSWEVAPGETHDDILYGPRETPAEG